MIAFAITCLLVATVFVALLSASDSLLRGWHSFGALRSELRALRADAARPASPANAKMRPTAVHAVRGRKLAAVARAPGFRAAA